jgi:hypothetical protein
MSVKLASEARAARDDARKAASRLEQCRRMAEGDPDVAVLAQAAADAASAALEACDRLRDRLAERAMLLGG